MLVVLLCIILVIGLSIFCQYISLKPTRWAFNQRNNGDETCLARVFSLWVDALGSYLSVALEVGVGQLGVGELQQSQRDRSCFRFGINVPNGTVLLTVRCVRRPAGKAERP